MTSNLVSDEDLQKVWGNANFGSTPRREVLRETLIKIACGFHTGSTATQICLELKLIGKSKRSLTKKGKLYLYYALESYLKPKLWSKD